MCGIAGFTSIRNSLPDASAVVRRMTSALRMRGPDGEGYYLRDNITLGHRRLSIIDLTSGAQPMAIDNDSYCIAYNGEVVNYLELRAELERHGHRFTSESDTEVILRCFAVSAIASFRQLNGMFAFALWDSRARRLILARDRIGIKPLYYCVRDGELIFASELKALLLHPKVGRRLDLLSVSKYFSYGYIPAPQTIFADIQKLEAGSWLSFDSSGIKVNYYWDIPLEDDPASDVTLDEGAEELLALLRDSVRIHLRSDVPVGLFLSGGIDSGAIAALAAVESAAPLHSFSIGFDQPSYDESRYARQLAQRFGTIHHEEVVTLAQARTTFPLVMETLDEPLADASAIPTYILSALARQDVKVVLGGDGGDELFAGYPAFQAHKLVRLLSFLPVGMRDSLGGLIRHLPISHRYDSIEFLMQQFIKGLGLSAEVRFLLWMGFYGNSAKKELFSAQLRTELLRSDAFENVSHYVRRSGLKKDFERLQYLCLKMYLADDVLTKVDRVGMAHSLEVRFPYLDNAVIAHACKIQPSYKLKAFTTKYILKKAVRSLLPDNIIKRRKAGFMMPVSTWLTNEMRETVEHFCSPVVIKETGLFDHDFVSKILSEHFSQRRDHRRLIYPLLCFMAWRQNYGLG